MHEAFGQHTFSAEVDSRKLSARNDRTAADRQLDRLLSEFTGLTAALTFTEDGLRAVLRIDRQQVDPKAQQP